MISTPLICIFTLSSFKGEAPAHWASKKLLLAEKLGCKCMALSMDGMFNPGKAMLAKYWQLYKV